MQSSDLIFFKLLASLYFGAHNLWHKRFCASALGESACIYKQKLRSRHHYAADMLNLFFEKVEFW